MSMNVPRDEPLTEAARQYLLDRSQHDLVAQIDAAYPPVEPPEDDYDTWEPAELRKQLALRELSTAGKKDVLIQRLRDDDAKADAAAEEEGLGSEEA